MTVDSAVCILSKRRYKNISSLKRDRKNILCRKHKVIDEFYLELGVSGLQSSIIKLRIF
jgi:hypothetical protein